MREHEKYTDANENSNELWRSSNYLTGSCAINKLVEFSFTGYYQVDINRMSDYRILINSVLTVRITSVLAFHTNIEYRFDNEPLKDIINYDVNILNGFSMSF